MKELQSINKSFMNVAVGTDPYMSEPDSASDVSKKKRKKKNTVKDILNSKKGDSLKAQEKKFSSQLDEIVFCIKGEKDSTESSVDEKIELIKSLLNIPKGEIFKSQDQ